MFNLTDDRKYQLAAIGAGLSQLSAGQPVNIAGSGAGQMVQQRQMRAKLEESGVLDRFTPDQRAILAQMPADAAMRVIAGDAFKAPPAAPKPMSINGQLVDPTTGRVIGDYRSAGAGVDPAKVQSSVPLDDGTVVMIMNDGTRKVLSPQGEELQGQAAADAILAARDYTTDNQRDIYAARQEGTLDARIDKGGTAKAAEDLGAATINAGVKAWEDYGNLQRSIGTIDEAIAAIDSGAEAGAIYRYLPDITESSASLTNAMDRMGLDVVGSVTFGALSEGELRLAMNTAVPRNLSGEPLRNWLVKKQKAQQKAANMLADAAQYMTTPGNTINGWIEKNKAMVKPTAATPAAASEDLPNFVTMSDDELSAWIKANGG